MNSTLQSGVRFKALPTREQAVALARWIGCQRFIYNGKVDEDRLFAAQRRLLLRDEPGKIFTTPVDNSTAQFKTELTPWLKEVPSAVLRQAVCRWRTAKQRQLVGLAKAPRNRTRRDFTSVRLDSDMFEFRKVADSQAKEDAFELHLGGRGKFYLGRLVFSAHRSFGIPKMLTISRSGTNWFVSFSYEHESPILLREAHELAYEANLLDDEALFGRTIGLDRNVKDNAFAGSDGKQYMLAEKVLERIARKRIGVARYQRQFARKQRGSKNQARMRAKIADRRAYERDCLRDFAHQTSHAIVSAPSVQVIGLEALQLANMVRKSRPKKDPASGKWAHNNRRAKAGLNRALLGRALGSTVEKIKYKAYRANKLVVFVPPHHTSQECSRCGHTHPDNRHEQRFVCRRCGFATHADLNAATNIKKRAIAMVRSNVLEKEKPPRKRVALRRKSTKGDDTPGLPVERM
jgi:putative transposase